MIERLRDQNKASSDAWTLKIAKLEHRYAYYATLFSHAIQWATTWHNKGQCPTCHQPHAKPQGRIAGHSQITGSLVTLDRMLDVVEAASEVNEGWAEEAYVEMPELGRLRAALNALNEV